MTDVRISQVPVQVIIRDSDPDVRLTQVPVQVVAKHSAPTIRLYQAPVQVLVNHGTTPEVRMYQAPVQVLVLPLTPSQINISVGGGNHPICDRGSLASGTYDYCLLLGGDPSTATFLQAGTVNLNAGEGTIPIPDGLDSATVILVIQVLDRLGAYVASAEEV